jgi:hypothetical protein
MKGLSQRGVIKKARAMKLNEQLLEAIRHVNGGGFPTTPGRLAATVLNEEKGDYEISDGKITLHDSYKVGQWVHISGSLLNDGLYRLHGVEGSLCMLGNGTDDEMPVQDEALFYGAVRGLRIDPLFMSLARDILAWSETNGKPTALTSESVLGVHSWSRATGANGVPLGWQGVFADRLVPFKRMFPAAVI